MPELGAPESGWKRAGFPCLRRKNAGSGNAVCFFVCVTRSFGSVFFFEGLFYVNGKKVILAGSLALLVSMTLVGCGSGPAKTEYDPAAAISTGKLTGQTLRVYCGAGMQKPFQQIADAFRDETGCDVQVTYANAAQIQTQIKTTAEGDFFIAGSAQEIQPIKDYVAGSKPLVKHIPVLAVSQGNPKHIHSLKDLSQAGIRVVMGDPKATPIGKIAQKAFDDAGIFEALHIVSTTTTAPQMATLLALQEADAAIIWKENCENGVEVVPTEEMDAYGKTIPAAHLSFSKDNPAADAFAGFLDSEEVHAIWASFGYELVP